MAMPKNAIPSILIDWYATGTYSDAIDTVSASVLAASSAQPIAVEYGRDTARSTSPPMISAANFTLANTDRSFSPENPSTPRYQFVKPGRPMRIRALHGTRGLYREHRLYREHEPYRGLGVYPLFEGNVSRLEQNLVPGDEKVDISGLGAIARLRRKIISVALVGYIGIGIRTDTAVEAVLDAAGWPPDKRELWVSDSLIRGWWVDERPAWDVLVELLATEGAGALMFEKPDGTFVWQNRNYRATQVHATTSQATLHDGTAADGDVLYTTLRYDPRWEDVVNRVTVSTKQRALDPTPTVIWKLGTTLAPTLTPQVIWARPQDPFQNAISPVLTTDYTVAGGTVAITLEWANGAVAKINVVALTGTPIVSDLQLRAQSFPSVGETQIEASVAVTSDDEEKTLAIAAWPELDPNHAQALCDSYLTRYQESRPIVEVIAQNLDAVAMEHILRFQISDRVTIVNRHLGLNTDAYIEKILHEIRGDGIHVVTLSCETVTSVGSLGSQWDVGVWNSALWGV